MFQVFLVQPDQADGPGRDAVGGVVVVAALELGTQPDIDNFYQATAHGGIHLVHVIDGLNQAARNARIQIILIFTIIIILRITVFRLLHHLVSGPPLALMVPRFGRVLLLQLLPDQLRLQGLLHFIS